VKTTIERNSTIAAPKNKPAAPAKNSACHHLGVRELAPACFRARLASPAFAVAPVRPSQKAAASRRTPRRRRAQVRVRTGHSSTARSKMLYFLERCIAPLILLLAAFAAPAPAAPAKNDTFKIPPVKIALTIKDQHVTIIASGLITMAPKVHGLNVLNLELTADLSDLQQNLTAVLASILDKDSHCADRIQIQDATITPIEPASLVIVQLHYERWACVKLFGKQQVQRLIGGNAVIQVKLTPSVAENHTELELTPELGPIQADGTLGELLRAGDIGEILRDKIQDAMLSAMQKGLDLGAILPPALQGDVTIQDARFKDAGSGHLIVMLEGVVQITDDQLQGLEKQLKSRLPFH
jgi:hypothetical protein